MDEGLKGIEGVSNALGYHTTVNYYMRTANIGAVFVSGWSQSRSEPRG